MRNLVFDTSSVISLTTNDLLWLLNPLKQKFKGDFCIPDSVKIELIDKPLATFRFKFEAMIINKIINEGFLDVHEPLNVDDLLIHVNSIYLVEGKPLHIVDKAEVEALALVLRLQADAYVVDERTMRMVIEDPVNLRNILEGKIHRKVEINKNLLNEFKEISKGVKIIRSTELVTVAYEKGLLDNYLMDKKNKRELVEAFLWGLRLKGCAISTDEINEIIALETR